MRHPQAQAVLGPHPEGARLCRTFGQIRVEGGRGEGHQASTCASRMATPMSPSILSLPDMKALVGFRSPSKIS